MPLRHQPYKLDMLLYSLAMLLCIAVDQSSGTNFIMMHAGSPHNNASEWQHWLLSCLLDTTAIGVWSLLTIILNVTLRRIIMIWCSV